MLCVPSGACCVPSIFIFLHPNILRIVLSCLGTLVGACMSFFASLCLPSPIWPPLSFHKPVDSWVYACIFPWPLLLFLPMSYMLRITTPNREDIAWCKSMYLFILLGVHQALPFVGACMSLAFTFPYFRSQYILQGGPCSAEVHVFLHFY